jgi:hypothetical protein
MGALVFLCGEYELLTWPQAAESSFLCGEHELVTSDFTGLRPCRVFCLAPSIGTLRYFYMTLGSVFCLLLPLFARAPSPRD